MHTWVGGGGGAYVCVAKQTLNLIVSIGHIKETTSVIKHGGV